MNDDHTDRPSACPLCHSPRVTFLPGISGAAIVDYYRCDICTNVWTVHKPKGEAQLTWNSRLPSRTGLK